MQRLVVTTSLLSFYEIMWNFLIWGSYWKIFMTGMSKPFTTDLYMPRLEGPPSTLPKSGALTFLLSKDNTVYYYHGDWEDAISNNEVIRTTINQKQEIRKLISDKQHHLDQYNTKEGRNALMFLIKPGKQSEYGNMIDILDEALIQRVKKYALLPLQPAEREFLDKQAQ